MFFLEINHNLFWLPSPATIAEDKHFKVYLILRNFKGRLWHVKEAIICDVRII
jgi:hypothetical protein